MNMDTKNLAIIVIALSTLITALVILAPLGERRVNAQMTGDHGEKRLGNMTSSQQLQHKQRSIINGTINLEQVIFQAINSRINTSLTQAMTTAERSVGDNAFAVAAFGSEEGGYFAYRIILATPEMKFYYVKVDPGNGKMLETQQVSQKELDKMHKEHSAMVVSNKGNHGVGVSGFPFIIPHQDERAKLEVCSRQDFSDIHVGDKQVVFVWTASGIDLDQVESTLQR